MKPIATSQGYARLRRAITWRIARLFGEATLDQFAIRCAARWRPLLKKPQFIGITGSGGKTTTKELLVGMLAASRRGSGNPASLNVLPEVARTILRVRPHDDFCALELSEASPGALDEPLAMIRPSIGIVTVIADDHVSAFKSRDHLAAEVSKLVESLPAHGTAVLNADDPLVLAMAQQCVARVITYGLSDSAELRAEDVKCAWPDRLELTLVRGTERQSVRTQLCGGHWVHAVLAAVGGGLAAGQSLRDCADGLTTVPPFDGRMQPVATADGVSFIRDDFKAPYWTIDACLDFVGNAHAKRKFVVIGSVSDIGSHTSRKYRQIARRAQEVADVTIFVGPWAHNALKERASDRGGALLAFGRVREAAEYIKENAQSGDLVLLKGNLTQDHLLRILLARTGEIMCWRDDCKRTMPCTECSHRMTPAGAAATTALPPTLPPMPHSADATIQETVFVGLGNPGRQYAGTPHNVGQAAVDRFALERGLIWREHPPASTASGTIDGAAIRLVRLETAINLSGPALMSLSRELGFAPEHCVLVHDDLALPIGTVRVRMGGGAGGHKGVASILESFQSDAFRRIKIGIRPEQALAPAADYVTAPFAAADTIAIDKALAAAGTRVVELLPKAKPAPISGTADRKPDARGA